MSEARIGRIAVGALHEALSDHLPLRVEFYESYLRPMGMRAGTIGLASFTAALSFLRNEGDAYEPVVRRAGTLAADWLFAGLPAPKRFFLRYLPRARRARSAMALTAHLAGLSVRGARGRVLDRRGRREVVIVGSPFCATRQRADAPLCGFYAAALQRFMERLEVPAGADLVRCRAVGDEVCVVGVTAADHAEVEGTPPHRTIG